jgi:hypothetical protein
MPTYHADGYVAPGTAYTSPNALFATDITVPNPKTIRLNISVDAAAVLRLKVGTLHLPMNGGTALVADQVYGFDVQANPNQAINFSLDTSCDINYAVANGIAG